MNLPQDLFNFISQKPSLAQKEEQSQAIQAFILEPILTPSGLVDDPTDGADLIIIDPNPGIDHSLDFAPDAHPGLDDNPDIDLHLSTETIAVENIAPLPFIFDSEPTIPSVEDIFNSGIFTVGESGKVSIDYLFDGGGYQGQLAIFNLKGMEEFDLNTETGLADFIHEAASRALSNSDLGHVVIADASEGAKFSGMMPSEWENHNFGEYQGVKTFDMQAGDKFAVMLVPNGTVQQVLDCNQDADIRPLFSLHTVNPNEAFHAGQIADVTGDGNTFVLEDLRTDHTTDRDYNDIIFQVRGATGTAAHLDDVINPELDWRHSDVGQELIAYANAHVEPVHPDPLPVEFPPNQPLIGIIDTGLNAHNLDIDYSRIISGHDYIDGDNNPLLESGEGSEHGTQILGIIGATTHNDIGVDGINDQAPLWVGRATGSGNWASSLVDFVDNARESHQPHAIANLSFDLTQINPDGSITTRTELTLAEHGALEYAQQHGVLVVVSSGNQGGAMSALGKASLEFDNIITVGAVGSDPNVRADYSSFGDGLDIVAPGGDAEHPVISTEGTDTGTGFGTSIATARVTGAASQVWAANPDLSYQQVKEILKATSTDIGQSGWDAETGAGLLNLALAVEIAQNTTPETQVSNTSGLNLPDLKTPILGSSQADNDVVYVSTSSGQILRIDTKTGEQSQVYQGRGFTDLAVAPSGKLYGSTFNSLFEIDTATGQEKLIGQFQPGLNINALTFSPDGKLYGADSTTGKLLLISPQTGQSVEMGSLGGPSSGDIIFNGRNQILATVRDGASDRLVAVDISTGVSETIGDLGFPNVYGLALLNGELTAFTTDGQKLAIDPQTGIATLIGAVSTTGQIWGAADNPSSAGIAVGELPQVLPEDQAVANAPLILSERSTDWLSQIRASGMGSDWRTEYDRAQNWIGNITSLWPQYWSKDAQGRSWEIVYTTNGFMIRTPGLGAFAFSSDEYNNTKSWDLFWKAVYAGLSRKQILALKDSYWDKRSAGQQIVGSLKRRGNGWTQEFKDANGNRSLLMLEDGYSQAFWVWGANLTEYEFMGGPEGRSLDGRGVSMGYPRSNEIQISRSDRKWAVWQAFAADNGKARIHHLAGAGSVATWGAIGSRYTDLGGASHWLGMPTRREYIQGNTIFSDFEGGRIAFNRNNGSIEQFPVLKPGASDLNFYPGQQWVTSTNYKFIFQPDRNLVLYNPQGKAIWATGTYNTTADRFSVQKDGNVVLYNGGKAVWATDTWGNPGASLAIQSDGNIVVYSSNGTALFNTVTYGGKVGTFSASPDWLKKSTPQPQPTPSDTNGTLGTAEYQGTFSDSNLSLSGSIGYNGDQNDFFRFHVANNRTNVNLKLSGLSADADLELIRDLNNNGRIDTNEVIGSSRNSGTLVDSVSRILDSGDYFVRVLPGTSSAKTNYNFSMRTAKLAGQVRSGSGDVNFWRYDTGGRTEKGIDPSKETVVIIHGWNNSDQSASIRELAKEASELAPQVLVLDWGSIAQAGLDWAIPPNETAKWIAPVARWAKNRLDQLGINSNQLTLIGHSLGTLVSSEIGRLFGNVKNLVALDPAYPADGDNGYDIDISQPGKQHPANFRDVATKSLAFVVADNNAGLAGDNEKAATANDSFLMRFDPGSRGYVNAIETHGAVIDAFTDALDRKLLTLPDLNLPSHVNNWYDNNGDKDNWWDRQFNPGKHEGTISAIWTGNKLDWSNGRNPWHITGLERVVNSSGTDQTTWT